MEKVSPLENLVKAHRVVRAHGELEQRGAPPPRECVKFVGE